MAAKVGQVTIDLEANVAKFERDMRRVSATFENALNPSKKLANEIRLLEQAGKSAADIWKVYGTRMVSVADATRKHGQTIDPVIAKYTQWRSGAEKLSQSLQHFAANPLQAMQAGMASLAATLGPVGIGFAALGVAVGIAGKKLFDIVDAASKNVESLENLSAQTGVTTQDLQALALIAKNAGMESIDLGRAVGRLNAELGKGKGDFVDALKALKISLKDASGTAKDGITLMSELGMKLKGMGSAAEIAQKGAAILGPRLTYLIPLFTQGTQSIREQMDAIESLGGAYDEAAKAGLKRFDRAMDAVTTVTEASKVQMLSFLASFLDSPKAISVFAGAMVSPVITFYRLGAAISSVHETWIKWQIAVAKFVGESGAVTALNTKLGEAMASTYEWNRKLDSLVGVIVQVGKDAYEAGNIIKTNYNPASDEAAKLAAKHAAALERQAQEVRDATRRLLEMKVAIDNMAPSLIENARLLNLQAEAARPFWERNPLDIPLPDRDYGMGEVGKASEQIRREIEKTKESVNGLGNAVSTVLTNMTQTVSREAMKWAGPFKDFASAALSAVMEGLFNPLFKVLTSLGNALGNWLTGLLGGGGGGGGGILGSVAGSATGAGGGGGATGAMTSGFSGGGAIGGAIAGGFAHLTTMTIGLLSNPITMIAGAAVGLAFGVKALVNWAQGPTSWEKMASEMKGFGGVKLSQTRAGAWAGQYGISESEAWGIRGPLERSPSMIGQLYALAQDQGKLAALMGSLSRVPSSGGGWGKKTTDYLTPFKTGLVSGDWGALNLAWMKSMSASEIAKVTQRLGSDNLSDLFMPSASGARASVSPQQVTVNSSNPVTIHIHGAGDDLVSRVRREVIPVIQQAIRGGSSGLREDVAWAVRQTQGAY